jgi:phage terminase large subunit-like protein
MASRIDAPLLSPWVARLLKLDERDRKRYLKSLPQHVRAEIPWTWECWARPDQIWSPSAIVWTWILAGRGWGKTRYGVEATRKVVRNPQLAGGRSPRDRHDKTCGEGAFIGIGGRTSNDVIGTMLYGPSGLITCSPPWERPEHLRRDRMLVWPNGTVGRLFYGDEPRTFLGGNIGFMWLDEIAHWSAIAEAFTAFELTLRHGEHPRAIGTTTPLGLLELVKRIFVCDENGIPIAGESGQWTTRTRVQVVSGSTYDNAANLAAVFLEEVVSRYEGTVLGEQEIHGRISLGTRGAIWKYEWFKRVETPPLDKGGAPDLVRVAIVLDPAVSVDEDSSEFGIMVGGVCHEGRLWLLRDASGHYTEGQWSDLVVQLAIEHDADEIDYEKNQGGNLIEAAIERAFTRERDRRAAKAVEQSRARGRRIIARPLRQPPIRTLQATKNKAERGALVSGLWEHGKVVHVGSPRGWVALEHQMTHFDPNKPAKGQRTDRMDAAVWTAIALCSDGKDRRVARALSNVEAWTRIAAELRRRASR